MIHFFESLNPKFLVAFLLLSRYTMTRVLFGNPGPLLLVVLFLSFFLLSTFIKPTSRQFTALFAFCGTLSIGAYIATNTLNLRRAGMFWHDEANILTIAAAYTRGQPIYHSLAGSAFYSLFYGPSTFLIYAPLLASSSHPISAIRIAVFIASLLELAFLFLLLRSQLSRIASLALLPAGAAFLLAYPLVLLGTRGDIWLLLCITLALLCVMRFDRLGWLGAALISGIFGGLSIDFKATVAPVVCLLLAILYRRYGLRAVIVSALSCTAAALALFLLPHIALSNYLAWLIVAGHQRLLRYTFLENCVAASFLLAPIFLIVVFGAPGRRRRPLGWTIPCLCSVALVACLVTGSKDGGGGWHLWPMLPFVLAGIAYEASVHGADRLGGLVHKKPASQLEASVSTPIQTLVVLASIAIGGASVTIYFAVRDCRIILPATQIPRRTKEIRADNALDVILHRSFPQHNLAMGYGATVTDYRTNLRFKLPLAGQQYFFDENAVVEGDKAGFPIPAKVVARILGCEDIWIVPHGDEPFSAIRGDILPVTVTPFLFPNALRLGFVKTHTLFEQEKVYDLWRCTSEKSRSTQAAKIASR